MKTQIILEKLKLKSFNEMQLECIESSNNHQQILLLSPTGSGKTLAFLCSLLNRIKENEIQTQALIIVPTRELALQIETVFKSMKTNLKINAVYGGHNSKTEINNLSNPPAILVGTPGRILFHIRENSFSTNHVQNIVIDEFDKCLEFGFQKEMESILGAFNDINFKMLTSATNISQIPSFLQFSNYHRINYLNQDQQIPEISYFKIQSNPEEKLEDLIKLLSMIGDESILIFCNHRDAVDRISETLNNKKVRNIKFHGGLTQDDREKALLFFRNKTSKILITTDLASRGIDIPEIGCVIHYQFPEKQETFIHRNGRTARMKSKGKVYVLKISDDNIDFINENVTEIKLNDQLKIKDHSTTATMYISAGKKDKINKVDIVGFLIQKGEISKNDIGLIEVRDNQSYVAVPAKLVRKLIEKLKPFKLKNKKVKIDIADF